MPLELFGLRPVALFTVSNPCRHKTSHTQLCCHVQVCQAISRAKKEEIVADLRTHLTNSSLVYGWKYENIAVRISTFFCVACILYNFSLMCQRSCEHAHTMQLHVVESDAARRHQPCGTPPPSEYRRSYIRDVLSSSSDAPCTSRLAL